MASEAIDRLLNFDSITAGDEHSIVSNGNMAK
jgi:hypothetical protein